MQLGKPDHKIKISLHSNRSGLIAWTNSYAGYVSNVVSFLVTLGIVLVLGVLLVLLQQDVDFSNRYNMLYIHALSWRRTCLVRFDSFQKKKYYVRKWCYYSFSKVFPFLLFGLLLFLVLLLKSGLCDIGTHLIFL